MWSNGRRLCVWGLLATADATIQHEVNFVKSDLIADSQDAIASDYCEIHV